MWQWLQILHRGRDKHKCLKCDLLPCMNLYRQAGSSESGEFHLYESTVKNRVHVPCEFGVLIHCLCKLSVPISSALSFEMYNQCIRDLKAVSFLVLCGHYRNSMQVMRPVIENFLTGLYWDIKVLEAGEDEEARRAVMDEHQKFTEQDRYMIPEEDREKVFGSDDTRKKKYLDQDFLLGWLYARDVIDGKGRAELQDQVGMLNRFLHPNFKATDFGRAECASCPSCVSFDESAYKQCVEIFQDITALLLGTFRDYIAAFPPEELDNKDVDEALGMVENLNKLESEIGRKLVFSEELREFIESLSEQTVTQRTIASNA